MNETIEYYNRHAQSFCDSTVMADMSLCRRRFLQYIPKGGRILDAGCGSGRDSRAFLEAGYRVEAFDASEAVCEYARTYTGLPVRCCRFEDFAEHFRTSGSSAFGLLDTGVLRESDDICGSGGFGQPGSGALREGTAVDGAAAMGENAGFDGIWACASLLHLPEKSLAAVLPMLAGALKRSGILYASFKRGQNQHFRGGRFFCDFTEDSLTKLISQSHCFKLLECFVTGDVRADREGELWVNIIARTMTGAECNELK